MNIEINNMTRYYVSNNYNPIVYRLLTVYSVDSTPSSDEMPNNL